MAAYATADGSMSTNEESQTESSVIYLERAYSSSFDESLTCGGRSSSKCDRNDMLVGGCTCQFNAFSIAHSMSSICFGPNCPLLKFARVDNLIFRTSCTLIAMCSVVRDASKAVEPLHRLLRVARNRSNKDMLTATTSLLRSKWSMTLKLQ